MRSQVLLLSKKAQQETARWAQANALECKRLPKVKQREEPPPKPEPELSAAPVSDPEPTPPEKTPWTLEAFLKYQKGDTTGSLFDNFSFGHMTNHEINRAILEMGRRGIKFMGVRAFYDDC